MAKIQKYHPSDDLSPVERAYYAAAKAHEGQKRKSGKPYFTHPYRVAEILADQMLDATTIAAGLLHDMAEDTSISIEQIEKDFGKEIALLVDGVTKLSRLTFTSKEEQQVESIRKMFLAMAKDIRVVIIKLADRLHNMRTLKFQDQKRQVPIAKETLDVYAPLAHRLGMMTIKWELEDLCLRYIDPAGYYDLVEKVGMKRTEREDAIKKITDVLGDKLKEANIQAVVDGRPKHFYSIYKKMVNQGKTFDQIHDLIAIRVIVNAIPDCYSALGVVHTLWTQVPNRFKDYISMPKGNMYQSLHTTVVGLGGLSFEVQIRTKEMHQTAEYGIAAHWRYKEGKQVDALDNKLYWLRQILDWQNEMRSPDEFMDALKVDLVSDEVFVFTPKGDVVSLPRGATPIDFAYHIHTDIGHKCVGAKVNHRIVPLGSELESGDFVEIMTSPSSHGPSRDWLQIVRTSEARSKIRAWFKHEFKDENMQKGRESLEREAKRLGYQWAQLNKGDYLEPIYRRYTLSSLEDLYVMVGFGGLSSAQILNRLIDLYKKDQPTEKPEVKPLSQAEMQIERDEAAEQKRNLSSHGIIVAGEPGMLVRFARCCTPIPGDEIVGYVTRGRGVSVHRADCVNMSDMSLEPERLIDVKWDKAAASSYSADVQIIANDRVALVGDISMMLAKLDVKILAMAARILDTNKHISKIELTLEVNSAQQLTQVINRLSKFSDVIEVFRVSA
jgi:GTP pyrophosphokinase